MVNKSCAPSPQKYNLPSCKMVQSFSFGVSRDKFERVIHFLWSINSFVRFISRKTHQEKRAFQAQLLIPLNPKWLKNHLQSIHSDHAHPTHLCSMTLQKISQDQAHTMEPSVQRTRMDSTLVQDTSPLAIPWYPAKENASKIMTSADLWPYQGLVNIKTSQWRSGGTSVQLLLEPQTELISQTPPRGVII